MWTSLIPLEYNAGSKLPLIYLHLESNKQEWLNLRRLEVSQRTVTSCRNGCNRYNGAKLQDLEQATWTKTLKMKTKKPHEQPTLEYSGAVLGRGA